MSDSTGSSYQYQNRQGIRPVSWNDVYAVCKGLALAVARYDPAIILGIARAGLYPATLLSHMLQRELYPIRLTRRLNDTVVYTQPRWLVRPPEIVRDQRVLLVDEICDSGGTLRMADEEVRALGAQEVGSAVLYSHTWAAGIPDYIGLITDALILNPWDREVMVDGRFAFAPEYVDALATQGIAAEPSLLLGLEAVLPAKGR